MCPSAGILMSAASVHQVSKQPLLSPTVETSSHCVASDVAVDPQICCSLAGYLSVTLSWQRCCGTSLLGNSGVHTYAYLQILLVPVCQGGADLEASHAMHHATAAMHHATAAMS